MSSGTACNCPESKKPVSERLWFVMQRNCNHSAFNGNRYQYSDYSSVCCQGTRENGSKCWGSWRTKAAYVKHLKDYKHEQSSEHQALDRQ